MRNKFKYESERFVFGRIVIQEEDFDNHNNKRSWKNILKYLQSRGWKDTRDLCLWIVNRMLEWLPVLESARAINQFKHLRKIQLQECAGREIKNQKLESLCSRIRRNFTELKELTLKFTICQNITNEGLRWVGKELGGCYSNLKCLSLCFLSFNGILDQGLKDIASNICRKQTQIKRLEFGFPNCFQITDHGFKALVNEVCHMPNLESLGLNFWQCRNITDSSLEALLLSVEKHLTHLKQLSVDLSKTKVKGLGFKIQDQLKSVEDLTLILSDCKQITSKGLETIGTYIAKGLPNLKKMSINISECKKITDKGLRLFGLIKASFPLEYLDINLHGCSQIADTGLIALSLGIVESVNKLEYFSIDIGNCGKITDDGLKAFISSISKGIITLKNFTVSCEWYVQQGTNISDKALSESFTEISKHLANLQTLKLCFRGCKNVTHKSFEILASELSKLNLKLQQLDLAFDINSLGQNKERLRRLLHFIPQLSIR